MRTSNLLLSTLKESPADAELVSHKLMLRAGLIRKLASGLYNWLPLGLRVVRKVETIIREEMNAIGGQEMLMPFVQPAELWEETSRWNAFGPSLLKIKDRHERDFCLGPTHEEVITDLARKELKSYKQLPTTLYQIQMKFRDEIRPRFGVMRAREFLMKDAYSFHLTPECLENGYQAMYQAYSNIFTRLGLAYRAVLADSGAIGGAKSQEFHVLADSGEDCLAYSTESEYAANVETAECLLPDASRPEPTQALSITDTPNIKSVPDQANYMGLETKQILKTLLVKGATEEHPVVGLLVRGDHELNEIKAEKHPLVASPFCLVDVSVVKEVSGCQPGFVGPKDIKIPLVADRAVSVMADFSCGANEDDKHYIGVNWERDMPLPELFDLRTIQAGDRSPDQKGTIELTRGIEVGHIFQLGTKYSESMKASVLGETGKPQVMSMGCYGIGVTRIVAAAIEQHYDEKGIIWPASMAPFGVVIVPIGYHQSEQVKTEADKLYAACLEAGLEPLLDDRKERPGVMFADMELIGIPKRVVISEKTLKENEVEFKARQSAEPVRQPLSEILTYLLRD